MAGAYPDAPGLRMALDTDGTVNLRVNGDSGNYPVNQGLPREAWAEMSVATAENIQDESTIGVSSGTKNNPWDFVGYVFPEPRELDGWYENTIHTTDNWEYYSQDTTNGFSGTWIDAGVTHTTTTTFASYRDDITSLALTGVRGTYCFNGENSITETAGFRRIHIYGSISPGETPDRILFLDTENSDAEFTKVLDFGDVPRGQTTTRTFKIKNNSSSLSINTVIVTAEEIYLNAGGWYEFGDGGGSYQATYAVGNMAQGAEETIHLKQVIPPGETLGLQAGRIKVAHASLS